MRPVIRSPIVFLFLAGMCLAGTACTTLGTSSLKADQVDYAQALGDAKKRQILSMIVGLRYADVPSFLNVSQIIAGYTFTGTAGAVLNTLPDAGGPRAGGTGMLSYSDHPTFTFTPTTGEDYAKAYIHPLPPALILPLAEGGVPIDLLLRITVQSIAGLNNATMLGGTTGSGSPGFFELLRVLRRLQLAGELSIEYRPGSNAGEIKLSFAPPQAGESAESAADVRRARQLLRISADSLEYEIVYGNVAPGPNTIPVITRSVLAILTDLGAEIAVSPSDVSSGSTQPTVGLVGGETRPIMVVHIGTKPPPDAYAVIGHRSSQYWIDDSDFDSKYALTVVQNLMALAEVTDTSHAPVVTVPAN
jgi:hypothetical protein